MALTPPLPSEKSVAESFRKANTTNSPEPMLCGEDSLVVRSEGDEVAREGGHKDKSAITGKQSYGSSKLNPR
jgi:hypothetical protein